MGKQVPWYESMFQGLYAKVLPNVFSEEQTDQQAQLVRRLLRLRKGQRVLDVPCGMGRLTIPLARMGLRMTGVDLAGGYIRRARTLARREGLDICFVQEDMRGIEFDGEFDAAVNWFGSFGYFDEAGNLEFCRRVHRALRPGGRFLIETMNRTHMVSHLRSQGEWTVGPISIRETVRLERGGRRVAATWTMSDGRTTEHQNLSIRLFTGAEMRAVLRQAGFTDVCLYGNPPLGRFTRHSRRMLVVARKADKATR